MNESWNRQDEGPFPDPLPEPPRREPTPPSDVYADGLTLFVGLSMLLWQCVAASCSSDDLADLIRSLVDEPAALTPEAPYTP